MSLDAIKEKELYDRTDFFVCEGNVNTVHPLLKFTFLNAKKTECATIYGFDYAGRPTLTWYRGKGQDYIATLP